MLLVIFHGRENKEVTRDQEIELSLKVDALLKEYVGFETPFVLLFPEDKTMTGATLLTPVSPDILPGILYQAAEMCAKGDPTRITLVREDGSSKDLAANVLRFPTGERSN